MTMLNLLLISLIVFISYNAVMIGMFGVPRSLSDTYYLLNEKKYGLGFLFTGLMMFLSFSLMIAWLNTDETDYDFLKFFCCCFLAFIGVAPNFKSIDKGWHTAFVYCSIVCGVLWIILCSKLLFVVIISIVIFLLLMVVLRKYKEYIYWLEIAVILSLYYIIYLITILL